MIAIYNCIVFHKKNIIFGALQPFRIYPDIFEKAREYAYIHAYTYLYYIYILYIIRISKINKINEWMQQKKHEFKLFTTLKL